MHRDALAELGESLRREFQELASDDPAALADLAEEAQRLLATLDGEMQALGAWLTSSSIAVAVDLPDAAPPSPEEAGPVRPASWPAAAPLAWLRSGDSARSQGRDAPWGTPRGVSEAERTVQPAPSAPVGRLYSGNTLSRPPLREEPAAFQPAAAARLETPAGGAGPGAGVPPQPPAGAFTPVKNLRDLARWVREASLGEDEAEGEGEPEAAPLFEPAFTITAQSDEAESGAAREGRQAAGQRLPASPEVRRPTAVLAQLAQDVAPPLPLPSRSVQSSQSISPSPPSFQSQERAPAGLPSAVAGVSQAPLPAGSPAGERTLTPPPGEAAEVDVESLLEALSRSVADEYKRFYGS
ncbi:MAG: hypothetical protein JF614_03060 [Acidobacteria bacterium]|nr:hypothetical protein [Acidobacteriota bacterium]